MGRACGESNESKKNAHTESTTALFCGQDGVRVEHNHALQGVKFDSLATLVDDDGDGGVHVVDNAALLAVNLPKLTKCLALEVVDNPKLARVVAPALVEAGNIYIGVEDWTKTRTAVTKVEFLKLKTVGVVEDDVREGGVIITGSTALAKMNFPALTATGQLVIEGNAPTTDPKAKMVVKFPSLAFVQNDVKVVDNGYVVELGLARLASARDFVLVGEHSLAALKLLKLTKVRALLRAAPRPSLERDLPFVSAWCAALTRCPGT